MPQEPGSLVVETAFPFVNSVIDLDPSGGVRLRAAAYARPGSTYTPRRRRPGDSPFSRARASGVRSQGHNGNPAWRRCSSLSSRSIATGPPGQPCESCQARRASFQIASLSVTGVELADELNPDLAQGGPGVVPRARSGRAPGAEGASAFVERRCDNGLN